MRHNVAAGLAHCELASRYATPVIKIDVGYVAKSFWRRIGVNGTVGNKYNLVYSFSFDYGSRNINTLKVEISQQGIMCYSFDAVSETPAIFKPGVYDIRLYQNGDVCVELTGVNISGSTEVSF